MSVTLLVALLGALALLALVANRLFRRTRLPDVILLGSHDPNPAQCCAVRVILIRCLVVSDKFAGSFESSKGSLRAAH